ncbi:MAG TPA: hypothetical protein PK637_13285 [Flavobacteriales bacterium]|nr:hypothetical protein [Flavobacteriales bacterium]
MKNTLAMLKEIGQVILKPYMKKELAALYDMNPRAFCAFIKPFEGEIGKKKCRYYTIHQVETLIKCVGLPRRLQVENKKNLLEYV